MSFSLLRRAIHTSLVICAGLAVGARAADERFPFYIPGDDASSAVTDLAAPTSHPAGADGFVRVQDGHFATDAGRLKIWGVNLTFGANFPEHADAEKVAAHLAKLGINAVRVHHHDTSPAPRGLWAPVVNGRRPLSAEQLERQDYFLNELHRRGIYAAVFLTSTDGKPLEQAKRVLVVLVGSALNRGAVWNETRTSLGNQWGNGPAEVNAIPATITWAQAGRRMFALDGRGQRTHEIAAQPGSAGTQFHVGSADRTLWYEVE